MIPEKKKRGRKKERKTNIRQTFQRYNKERQNEEKLDSPTWVQRINGQKRKSLGGSEGRESMSNTDSQRKMCKEPQTPIPPPCLPLEKIVFYVGIDPRKSKKIIINLQDKLQGETGLVLRKGKHPKWHKGGRIEQSRHYYERD